MVRSASICVFYSYLHRLFISYESIHSPHLLHSSPSSLLLSSEFLIFMIMAPSRSLLVFFFLVLVSSSSFSGVVGFGRKVGGRTPIDDVTTNKEVQELGRFSVEEYNRLHHRHHQHDEDDNDLTFYEVVRAEIQVVSGIKYYLKVAAAEKNGVLKTFDAAAVVKPWLGSKELLSFSPTYSRP